MARRGCLISGIVIVGLVGGGLVFADHQFRGMAESTVEAALVDHGFADGDQPVSVKVGGGPVLLQLAKGRLDEVQIDAHSKELDVNSTVHAELDQVSIRAPYDSDKVKMTLSVPASELPKLVQGRSSMNGVTCTTKDEYLQCGEQAEVASKQVPVTVNLAVSAADDELVLTPTSFAVAGISASAAMLASMGAPSELTQGMHIPVEQVMPTSLTLSDASVSNDAMTFTVEGTNVPLGDLGQ